MAKKTSTEIPFHLVSKSKLDTLTTTEKLAFILEEVKKGRILVLEQGLTATEQASLIKNTMNEIDQDTFIGIEMEGYRDEKTSFIQRVFGLIKKPRMTVIGPANLLKTIHKDNDTIETMIIPGKGET
ncbi:MAG: DUF2073 domain-containing protein [Methanobacteriota archaeon]